MSDTWVAPGWWLANDGRWYPPVETPPPIPDVVGAPDVDPLVDRVLELRAEDQPFVLDLRGTSPTVEVGEPETQSDPDDRPPASHGDRWGRHRSAARPVRSRVVD